MKLGTLAAHIFFQKLDIGPSQISHVTRIAVSFKKSVGFLHLLLINL